MIAVAPAELVGTRAPRIRSVPRFVSSRGLEAIEVAESCGLILDEWQRDTLIDACGLREDGRWSAPEVALDLPRQNGKGAILEARELAGVFAWGERTLIHSAHEFATATEAFLRMEGLLEAGGLHRELKPRGGVSRSHGHEGFNFKSGQRLKYRTRTGGGGRGFTVDGALVLDEAMVLKEAFMGALDFTQSGRSMDGNPQTWYAGSAVDQSIHEHGVVFARLRERGLAGDPSLAWFEWSAEVLDADGTPIPLDQLDDELLADESLWAQANPGLGIRISPEWVGNELRRRAARTFAVERLGVGDWPQTDTDGHGPIAVEDWDRLADERSRITGRLAFAFDVTPDRRSASIAVAGERTDGRWHVEVVESGAGTGWVAARLAELDAQHVPVAIVCDGASPAASLVPEAEDLGLTVQTLDARSHANACGLIFDTVEQAKLRHLGTPDLRAAIKGASSRPLGEAWAWSRKNSGVNIAPLVACTAALWGVSTEPPPAEPFGGAW